MGNAKTAATVDLKGGRMKKKVVVRAPALTRTGYGEHGRFVLRALRQLEDQYDVFLVPVNWGASNWIWENDEERIWLDSLIKKAALYQQQGGKYDMSIQVTIPNEWEKLAPINIGVTAGIETNRVAPIWLEKANMVDKVITVSEHSKNSFTNTTYEVKDKQNPNAPSTTLRCTTPINVVHYPVKNPEDVELKLSLASTFNFLTVAQWGPRKNLGPTIQWFVEEFIDNPEVGLVIKTFAKGGSILDRYGAEGGIKGLVEKYKNRKCKIYLLHGDLSEAEMHSLYRSPRINAFVSLSHGEGFGLPHFEAAYCGLPVIAPEWSGYLDFLCKPKIDKKGREKLKPYFTRIDYDLAPVQKDAIWKDIVIKDSMWCYAHQGSYKMKLREIYKDYGRHKKVALELQEWIVENFTAEKQYKAFLKALDTSQSNVEVVSDTTPNLMVL